MSITFTKLFSSITESTVWCEPSDIRIVWITMLAMADKKGRVWASVPGLANRARVSIGDTEAALQTFLGPDKYSRTPDYEGRRIEAIDGGWRLLNYDKYRATRDEDDRKEYKKNWIKEHRKKSINMSKAVDNVVDNVDRSRPQYTQAEAEAEAEAIKDLPSVSGEAPSNSARNTMIDKKPLVTRRPKPPADPNVKRVIDHYYQAYLARFKSPPPIVGGKCGTIAKRLLAGRSLADAQWLITAHLERAPEMYERKNLYGLEHVLHAAPVLLARRAKDRGDCE